MLHYIHGMGDKQIGNAIFFLKIQKQVDNLRLDRNIQGRYCFITNNKLGLKSQGLCNSDSLALTAGKFMGVSICIDGVQAHLNHQILHFFSSLLWSTAFLYHKYLGY